MQPETEATKKCPYCAETIKAEAVVCRYCGKDLTAPAPAKNTTGVLGVLVLVVFVICIFAFVVVPQVNKFINGTATPEPTVGPIESAWYACETFIQQQLGVSSLDAQRYNPGGVTEISSNQYQVDVFYANTGSIYRCIILQHENGDSELVSLKVR